MLADQERFIAQHITDKPLPQALGLKVSKHLHKSVGDESRTMRINIRDGFDLTAFDFIASKDVTQLSYTEPCISVCILIQASGYGTVKDASGTTVIVPHLANSHYVSVIQKKLESTAFIPEQGRMNGIDLRLSYDFLRSFSSLNDLCRLDSSHDWHFSSDVNNWIGFTNGSNQSIEKASCILNEVFSGTPNDLSIESCALDLLSETFKLIKPQQNTSINFGITNRQKKLIKKANELLLGNIAHSWTLKELAQQVGTNEKSLKQGFRALYGAPVYQYLQSQRMSLAKTLLATGNRTISDVSLSVGYANPSHFSYLFKREFNCLPSSVKQLRKTL